MPFECDESVAGEELVWVELGDAGLGLTDDEIRGLMEVLADPAVVLELVQQ